MNELQWIVSGGLLMAAIAMVGSVTLFLDEASLEKILLPLVAFAAGSLIGGAFFHMLPAALDTGLGSTAVGVAAVAGFVVFFMLEQFLHWRHCHRQHADDKAPLTYLILLGDGLHNFLGGLAIGGTFLIDIRLGITAWLAAAAHEVPQELGDFGVLVHGGWSKRKALAFNVLSGLTFLVGGLVSYALSSQLDLRWLIPFAAGNFLYIGAADLVPEISSQAGSASSLVHLAAFLLGIVLLVVSKLTMAAGG